MDMRGVRTEDRALWGGGGRAEGEWRGEGGIHKKHVWKCHHETPLVLYAN